MTKKYWTLTALVTVLALACPLDSGYGDVVTFDNDAGNKLWGDPLNWDTDTLPGPTDDAVVPMLNSGDNVEVDIFTTINSLQIGGGGGAEQVRVMSTGDLLVNTDILLGIVEDDGNRAGDVRTQEDGAFLTINGNIVANSPADNDIVINRGTFSLAGDIIMTGDNRIDSLEFDRGEFLLTGIGPQTLTVQQFDLAVSGADRDATFALETGKTLITVNPTDNNDIGRTTETAGAVDVNSGFFDILGGTATFAGLLRVGSVADGGTNSSATGIITVGSAGTLTANNGLQMAMGNDDNVSALDPTQIGEITVNGVGSTVTVAGGIRMAETDPRAEATITINDGLFQLTSGDITTGDDVGTGTSIVNLNGGTFELAATDSVTRVVTEYSHADGATLKLAIVPGMATLEATTMTLAASTISGGSVIDLDTSPTASTTTFVTWDGGTATWDADATKWTPDLLPADGTMISQNDEFTLLRSGSSITNRGNARLDASDTADWSLDQTSTTEVKVTRTGADVTLGPAVAVIDNAASIVTRNSDLNIQAAAGQGADASQLNISDGSLTLSGSSNLLLGAGPGEGNVNQSGGTVTVGGELQFGSAAGDRGGVYTVSGGTLDVQSIVLANPDVETATLIIDEGGLNNAGDAEVNLLIVGDQNDAALTITDSAFSARSGNQLIGNAAGVTATLDIGGSATVKFGDEASGSIAEVRIGAGGDNTTNATVTLSGTATVEVYGNNTEVGVDGNGTLDIQGGTWSQLTNNLVISQNHDTNAAGFFTMSGGVYDLRPSHTANSGQGYLNFNDSDKIGGTPSTATITGGTMYIGGNLQMTDIADASGVLTIDGGNVNIGENINYRNNNNGTDTINLKSGNLVFSDAPDVTNAINADSTGTNSLNWTGGRIAGLEEVNGVDLVQKDTDSPSLLQIGSSAGTMTIGQNYLLDAGDNTLEIELFAQGTTAGTDFDLLTMSGNATLAGILDVLDQSGGAIDTGVDFEWNVVEADEISLFGTVNLPSGFDFRVLDDFDGGPTDVLQIFTAGTSLACDFNGDAVCDIVDINLMLAEGPVAPGVPVTPGVNEQFDLNGDNVIDNADVTTWLGDAATANGLGSPYKEGDANLDGVVDVSDFNLWNGGKFTSSLDWDAGNFNGDAVVDVSDFNMWNGNKFTSSDSPAAVPEPHLFWLLLSGLVVALARRADRRG